MKPIQYSPRSPIATLFLFSLFIGCADISDEPLSMSADDRPQDKVINGQQEEGYPQAVALTNGGDPFCTGTLITPTVVLTAGHCIQYQGDFAPPSEIHIYRGVQVIERIQVSDWVMHHEWNSGLYDGTDVALVYLATPARTAPIQVDQTAPRQYVGQLGKVIGFGMTDSRDNTSSGVKNSVNLKVNKITGALYELQSYDATLRSACRGDSGGPLVFSNGVAGVASFVDGTQTDVCTNRSYYTSVYPHLAWIQENLSGVTHGRRRIQDPIIENGSTQTAPAPSQPAPAPSQPAPSPSQPSGTLTCAQAFDCMAQCTDQLCYTECYQSVLPSAQATLNELDQCLYQNQCQTFECATQRCSIELNLCGVNISLNTPPEEQNQSNQPNPTPPPPPPPTPTGGTCDELATCLSMCLSNDDQCIGQCAQVATDEAIDQYIDFSDCSNMYQCEDESCLYTFCSEEIYSCFE